jgi:signal transduction histidine kinase
MTITSTPDASSTLSIVSGPALGNPASLSPASRGRRPAQADLPDQGETGIRVAGATRTLIEALEEERRWIARELHDVVGQALTGARLSLLALREGLDDSQSEARVQESMNALDHALATVRTFATDLRPAVLDDLGLEAAMRSHLARVARDSGLRATLECGPLPAWLRPEGEIACFRVFQEALTNVTRHAAARRVAVVLGEVGGNLQLTVKDDGVGFDIGAAVAAARRGESMGLASMSERARILGGTLILRSTPGRGAVVRATIPRPPDVTVDRASA